MMKPTETAHPKFTQLVSGHFNEGKDYQNWREQGTKDHLMILTLSGEGRLGLAEGKAELKAGELVLLKPGTRHDYGTALQSDHWELMWVHFHPRPHWLEWLELPAVAPGIHCLSLQNSPDYELIVQQFHQINRLTLRDSARNEEFGMNALELLLLLCDRENPSAAASRQDPRIRIAMDYLCKNCAETVSQVRLAETCSLSISRLSHLFKAQTGVSLQQYQEQQRLSRAKQLLALTGRSVQSISEELGFSNPFYFSNRFRRATGCSPTEYRKMQ